MILLKITLESIIILKNISRRFHGYFLINLLIIYFPKIAFNGEKSPKYRVGLGSTGMDGLRIHDDSKDIFRIKKDSIKDLKESCWYTVFRLIFPKLCFCLCDFTKLFPLALHSWLLWALIGYEVEIPPYHSPTPLNPLMLTAIFWQYFDENFHTKAKLENI